MNSRSIGPNLVLSPDADPGDGLFEVVLIPEDQRSDLAAWIKQRIDGEDASYTVAPIKGTKITIHTEDTLSHTDDELIALDEPERVTVVLQSGVLEFLVPGGAATD